MTHRLVILLTALLMLGAGGLGADGAGAAEAGDQATPAAPAIPSVQGLPTTPAAPAAEAATPVPATPAAPAAQAVPAAPVAPVAGSAAEKPAAVNSLGQWRQAFEARLAQIDPNAMAVAPPVGYGPSLKVGASGGRVDRLAAQLSARGFLAADAYHGGFDETLGRALQSFQTSVGLNADGVAGDTTVEALDRGAAASASALKQTLGEMATLTANAPKEFFMVNIPSQTAYLIQDGVITMAMRTAVGRPSRPTPLLKDEITDVILNPTWTAPITVLAKDKLPNLRRTGHPGIEGATVYLDKVEVDPAMVDWSTVTAERVRVVQSPGNQNALGRFKFNLTNDQSISLHDTNDQSVFSRQGRALSSGCVRLAEPRHLAETLLGRDGWSPARIAKAVNTGHTQGIGLSHPLPVRIVYWLATVDDTGIVHIHKDIYERHIKAVPVASAAPSATKTASATTTTTSTTTTSPTTTITTASANPSAGTSASAPAAAGDGTGTPVASAGHPAGGQMSAPTTRRAAVEVAVQRVRHPEAVAPCEGSYCGLGLY